MIFKICDTAGAEINRIVADEQFTSDYCQTNGYTYQPVETLDVEPAGDEPSADEDNDAMLIDHEYRLTLLELGVGEEVTE